MPHVIYVLNDSRPTGTITTCKNVIIRTLFTHRIGVSFVYRVRMSSPFALRLLPVAIAFQVSQFRMLFSRAIVILLYNLIFSSCSFMFACCLSIIILLSCVIICFQFTARTSGVVIDVSEGQITRAELVEITNEKARNRERSFWSIVIVTLCEMSDNVKGASVFILREHRLLPYSFPMTLRIFHVCLLFKYNYFVELCHHLFPIYSAYFWCCY